MQKHSTFKHLQQSASYGYKNKYRWWPFVDIAKRYLFVLYWTSPIYIYSVSFIKSIFLCYLHNQLLTDLTSFHFPGNVFGTNLCTAL